MDINEQKKTKTKTKIKHPFLCGLCVVVTLLSLVSAVYGGNRTRDLTRHGLNFNELTPETAVDGVNTEGTIYAANGTYGQKYVLKDDGTVDTETSMYYYYLIPANDNYCITVYTNDVSVVDKLYSLTLATEKFSKGETDTIEEGNFFFSGRLSALSEDELSHLYSWAISSGMFGAEDAEGVRKYIIPYKIYTLDTSAGLPYLIAGSILFAVSAVLILILVKQRVAVSDLDDD